VEVAAGVVVLAFFLGGFVPLPESARFARMSATTAIATTEAPTINAVFCFGARLRGGTATDTTPPACQLRAYAHVSAEGITLALRKFVDRLTKPIEQVDREKLSEWCSSTGCTSLAEITVRKPVRVSGEVRSIRIVPRSGADALEATITDGHGVLTAVFLGRRKILGISPGRRVFLEGVVAKDGSSNVMYNPLYEFAGQAQS